MCLFFLPVNISIKKSVSPNPPYRLQCASWHKHNHRFPPSGEYPPGHLTVIAAFQEKRQHVCCFPPLEPSACQCELGGTKTRKQKQSLSKIAEERCMSSQRKQLFTRGGKKKQAWEFLLFFHRGINGMTTVFDFLTLLDVMCLISPGRLRMHAGCMLR